MELRVATEHDLGEIMELERLCFSMPWTEGQMLSEIYNPHSHVLTARDKNSLAGYAALRIAEDEAELMSIASSPKLRRRGTASLLLRELVNHAAMRGAQRIFLEVRMSNAAAQALYIKHGFTFVGTRRGYYSQPEEDAAVMLLEVGGDGNAT